MDRRSFLFVMSLTLTLFLVNYYFQSQNEDQLRQWSLQQKAKKTQQIQELEKNIRDNTASLSEFTFVDAFTEDRKFVANGLLQNESFLTVSRSETPAPNLAINSKNFLLAENPKASHQALLYRAEDQSPLLYTTLPEFGKFKLQVISPSNREDELPRVFLAEYVDGHFSIPQLQLNALKKEIQDHTSVLEMISDGIVLYKTTEGYLPVGIYQVANGDFIALNENESILPFLKKPASLVRKTTAQKGEEVYYVLENDYMQLVISNKGGAVSEINLPFKNANDKDSVVREIEFDRQMIKQHPYNAHFPAHKFFSPGASEGGPYIENERGQIGSYYPLIRRDLIQAKDRTSIRVPPQYYAFNLISEYPDTASTTYTVKSFTKDKIILESNLGHRKITKTYSFEDELGQSAPYIVNLTIDVEGDARGLWLTSGVPEVEWISGGPAPSLKFRITRNQKSNVENIDLPKEAITVNSVQPDWISNSNGFLGMIMDPLSKIDSGYRAQLVPGTVVPSRLVEIDQQYDRFKAQNMPGYNLMLPLNPSGGQMKFRLFAGPFEDDILEAIDKTYSDPATGYNPDYIACQTFHGWFSFISEPFADFLFILMRFFHWLTNSWALSIVLLTVALRIMLYPLNAWSTKSMLSMQQIAPEVTAIQEKYKKDPKKAQLEVMNLYREKGINPLSGCLPLLIQMPFLIGMFDLLKSTFELRGASFIPGWIDDLTAPDVLFSWSRPIFFIGNEFHLLPFLLGGVMFLQQKLSSNLPSDPNLLTEQQRQQKAMATVMPIIFTVMFYNFPSGLNIYWLSSMLLGIGQQWITQKQMQKAASLKEVSKDNKIEDKKKVRSK